MRAYVGQTRAVKLIHRLVSFGFGECVSRGEFPPRRTPWFLDNGAFGDWGKGRPFDEDAFARDLSRAHIHEPAPDFVVAPDVVAAGDASLALSCAWVERINALRLPVYLVVQDGMTEESVRAVLSPFDGVFVGGSLGWKLRTGDQWVQFAHRNDRPCHIGRVGTEARVRWALRIGADSIDSSLPLWAEANLQRFLRGFQPPTSLEFGFEVAS